MHNLVSVVLFESYALKNVVPLKNVNHSNEFLVQGTRSNFEIGGGGHH